MNYLDKIKDHPILRIRNKSNLNKSLIYASFIFLAVCFGCGGGGSSSNEDPAALTYTTTSAVYTKNLAITDNVPSYSGTVTEWSVIPSLPEGLNLDSNTGIISGTPVADQGPVEYTITASGNSVTTSTVISITINDNAPSALTYKTTSAIYTKGLLIEENTPTVTGTVKSWTITPDLPAGLTLDPYSGIISGVPESEQTAVYYSVTAVNTGGTITADISITINTAPPTALSYSMQSAIYTKNMPIQDITPTISGTVASWTITPELPDGLTLDPSSGHIYGTPSVEQSATDYTITAANSSGSTTAVITITINDQAPAALNYSNTAAVYTVGAVISDNTPEVTGTVKTYSVTPDLPTGLTLNTTTGVISGTPVSEIALTKYTITASNSGGSTSTDISITVNYAAPSGLTYSNSSAIHTKGVVITNNIPEYTGTVTSWSVYPNLPEGLILNKATGVISGTPAGIFDTASYTITASNSGGSTKVVITIKVNDVPPTLLRYTPSKMTIVKWGPFGAWAGLIINMVPGYNGVITSWSIDRALPSGLAFNRLTGVISGKGTKEAGRTHASYTITATNSGGSTTAVISIDNSCIFQSGFN